MVTLMSSTRYGKVGDDLELSTRSRNPQVREVQWLAPDEDDPRGAKDLRSKALLILRRLSCWQKVGICFIIFIILFFMFSQPIPEIAVHGSGTGTVMEAIRDTPVFDVDDNGRPLKTMIGEILAGHLIEVSSSMKMNGYTFYLMERGGAVMGESLKLAEPEDAAKFLGESLGEQEDMRAQDYNAVAIEEGTPLQVIQQGPVYDTDQHGVVWGAAIDEVHPGQIVHAAASPITEDGHTTVNLQTGGAIDISLVQVAEQVEPEPHVPGQHYREDPPVGYPGHPDEGAEFEHEGHPGYAEGHPGYAEGHPGYPEGHPGYPEGHPGYPEGHPGYPEGHPGYAEGHPDVEGHPAYPEGHPGYPEGHPGYPEGHPGYAEGHPGYPEDHPPGEPEVHEGEPGEPGEHEGIPEPGDAHVVEHEPVEGDGPEYHHQAVEGDDGGHPGEPEIHEGEPGEPGEHEGIPEPGDAHVVEHEPVEGDGPEYHHQAVEGDDGGHPGEPEIHEGEPGERIPADGGHVIEGEPGEQQFEEPSEGGVGRRMNS